MLKKVWRFTWKLFLTLFLLSVVSALVFRFIPVPFTPLMLQRCVEQVFDGEGMKLSKDWVAMDEMPNNIQLAVVASEDQNFLFHHGFDLKAIEKAMKYNEKQKKRKKPRMHGASTISQQCAKNVFLWQGRNFIRKGLEVYFTFLIELVWSKERIMQVYLNVIEMGDGIYGVEAASQQYFHKSAKNLTNAEAALIAACLPNPRKFNAGRPSSYVLRRQAFILGQMSNLGGRLDYEEKEEEDEKE